jgi:hypothetical protein
LTTRQYLGISPLGSAVAVPVAVWNGTDEERDLFMAALSRNCTCSEGQRCDPHAMITSSNGQKIMDHMLFCFRIRDRLICEEFAKPRSTTSRGSRRRTP